MNYVVFERHIVRKMLCSHYYNGSWQQVLDNGGFIGTILMDLSKAYDCIRYNLLIAKLECYGVDKASLRLLLYYLTHRKQRTKIGSLLSF